MQLSPAQRASIVESLDGDARVNLWHGSIRAGKTLSSILAWSEYVRTAPPGPLVMIGKTKDTLGRNVLDEIDALFGQATPLSHTRGANEGRLFGRTVHMIGASDAKAEGRIRGLTLAGAYVDEATLLPSEQFWSQLRGRFATVPTGKIFATTNPDAPGHWLKKNTLDIEGDPLARVASWHFKIRDNPRIGDDEISELTASMSRLFRRRFIDGLWSVAEGAVLDAYDDALHVVPHDALPTIERLIAVGIDWGTTNPTRSLLLALCRDERGPLLALIDEWQPPTGLDTATQTRLFAEWSQNRHEGVPIFVDPAANALRVAMQSAGIATHPAHNAVVSGIQTVSGLLAARRLVISDRCSSLIEEIPGYVWDAKATARGEDKPVKANDHSVDAMRYAIHSSAYLWRHLIPLVLPDVEPAATAA